MEYIMDSNMIKGVNTLRLIMISVSSMLLLSGCDETKKSSDGNTTAGKWIAISTATAEKIPTKYHSAEHDRSLARTAVTALDLEINNQSERILESVNSWRKAQLYANLARKCYIDQNLEEGDELIEKARQYLRDTQFENWQVSRVHVAIERATHVKGEKTRADLVRKVEPAEKAKLLPVMVESNVSYTNLVDMVTRLEATTNSVLDIDTASGTVDSFLVLYKKAQLSEDDKLKSLRKRILAGVEATFKGLHSAIACEKLVDFCNVAIDANDKAFADQLEVQVDEKLPAVRVDLRLPVELRYADYLIKAEKIKKAIEHLAYVENNAADKAILFSDVPGLIARCGVLYGKAGDKAKQKNLIMSAINRLSSFENSRPRAVAIVDLCLICARADVNDKEIFESVVSLSKGLSDPW